MSDKEANEARDQFISLRNDPMGDIMEVEQKVWENGQALERIEHRIESISCIVNGIAICGAVLIIAVGVHAALTFETTWVGEIWNSHGRSPWSFQGVLSIMLMILAAGVLFLGFIWSVWKAIKLVVEGAGIDWKSIRTRLSDGINRKKPSKVD